MRQRLWRKFSNLRWCLRGLPHHVHSQKIAVVTDLKTLPAILLGHANVTAAEWQAAAVQTQTAATWRQNTYGKQVGQDVAVMFAGHKWHVCYLSTAMDGSPVVTLWLAENFTAAPWNCWCAARTASRDWPIPANMYGACCLRAVTLNNGGTYCTNVGEVKNPTELVTAVATVDPKHPLANLPESQIVPPVQMPWQLNQSAGQIYSGYYNCPNDDLCGTMGSWYVDASGKDFNYLKKELATVWGHDALWLPSVGEVGLNDEQSGLWQLSRYQREFTSRRAGGHADYCWLRSGHHDDANDAYYVHSTGKVKYCADNAVTHLYGVRPAINLRLELPHA